MQSLLDDLDRLVLPSPALLGGVAGVRVHVVALEALLEGVHVVLLHDPPPLVAGLALGPGIDGVSLGLLLVGFLKVRLSSKSQTTLMLFFTAEPPREDFLELFLLFLLEEIFFWIFFLASEALTLGVRVDLVMLVFPVIAIILTVSAIGIRVP